jgi:hypothetical protein
MHYLRSLLLFASLLPLPSLARLWRTTDPCPESIKTTVSSYSSEYKSTKIRFATMDAVHLALTTCPNITSLDLRVTGLGCTEWPDRWNFPFKLEGGEKYPPLREIKLEGYRFSERAWEETKFRNVLGVWGRGLPWYERVAEWTMSGKAFKQYQYSRLPEQQRTKDNLDLWLDAMDWSKVESLNLMGDNPPPKIVPHLKGLKKLEIEGYGAQVFVQGLPNNTLTHLTSISYKNPPDLYSILLHQGHLLEHLEVRAPEQMSVPSPTYNNSQLEHLTDMAPNLSHLSINLPRNGTWPFEILETLSRIRSLRTLDLWLDITSLCQRGKPDRMSHKYDQYLAILAANSTSCDGEAEFLTPFVNETSSLEVFNFMKEHKVGEELKNVTFWVGDWSRSWDGPLYFPDWLEHRSTKVFCSEEGKQEGEAWCEVLGSRDYWKKSRKEYDWED